jgi:signal transduction histidine kinase
MVLNILLHTKKRKPDRSHVLLPELIKEIILSIKPRTDKQNINLKIDFPHDKIYLNIDRIAILAAFSSILENAVDACMSKEKNAKISFLTRIDDLHVSFCIKDNGKGLNENKKDKIFNLFYSDKGNKGTGLGLFIASRSIKQHGGSIKVNSKLNQYTEFIVTLPLK